MTSANSFTVIGHRLLETGVLGRAVCLIEEAEVEHSILKSLIILRNLNKLEIGEVIFGQVVRGNLKVDLEVVSGLIPAFDHVTQTFSQNHRPLGVPIGDLSLDGLSVH